MKNLILFSLVAITLATAQAQVIYPFPIPDHIPEYNGTYEDFGQNHFFYPNGGEIRLADKSQSTSTAVVQFYTQFTYPKEYVQYNTNLSFVFFRRDSVGGALTDSLHRVDLKMDRSSDSAHIVRIDTQYTCVLNYFNPYFSSGGRTNVQGGATLAAQNIYHNIDMVYCSNNAGLKIFYIVYPGGNPNDVVLNFDGAKSTALSGSDLIVQSNWDNMTFVKPQMYQYSYVGSTVTPVTVCNASWQSLAGNKYGITTTSSWNSSLPLIIEVSQGAAITNSINGLKWSTYLGGSLHDAIFKARSDASNNLFTAGLTTSPNFPANAGPMVVNTTIGLFALSAAASDGFMAKFNPAGVLQWVTYMGGSDYEQINDFDFKSGDMYCVGQTHSTDLPVHQKTGAVYNSAYTTGGVLGNDGFIFQLNATGQTNNWLTYFGGNKDDELTACVFDNTGAFFVSGQSNSTNMSAVGPSGAYIVNYNTSQLASASDAIIMKFNSSTCAQDWFTFYGTTAIQTGFAFADDQFSGLYIDGTDLYACGFSGGTNLPNSINSKFQSNFYDGILSKFTTSGAIVTAKYTNGNANNNSVAVWNSKIYTCGRAKFGMTLVNSGNYYYDSICTLNDDDACFSVHSLNLATTSHCTYLGDVSYDEANEIHFSSNGIFYISGGTESNFPVSSISGMYNASQAGVVNYFVSAFRENDVNFVWSTCLGSNMVETDVDGHCASIAIDGQGFLNLCGVTNSYNTFPVDNGNNIPYFQSNSASTSNTGKYNGTITRFDLTALNVYVGIKDFANTSFSFGLYPNPTSKYLVVDNQELLNQNLKYAVYDLQGKKLDEGSLNTTQQKNIDVSKLQQGVYFINVSNGTRTFSNKFVKTDN